MKGATPATSQERATWLRWGRQNKELILESLPGGYGQDTYEELVDGIDALGGTGSAAAPGVTSPSKLATTVHAQSTTSASADMPQLYLVETNAYTKDELVMALDKELDQIDADLDVDANSGCSLNEITANKFEQRLNGFFHSALLKRIGELKANDPSFMAEDTADSSFPEDVKDAELWNEMKSKEFRFTTAGGKGNPMASRWQRAIAADKRLKENYNRCRSVPEKDKFRSVWCERLFKEWALEHGVESSTEETKATGVDGQYVSLHRISWLEGGGAAGMRAAMRYCARCTVLQGKWTMFDEFTGTVKYLYLTHVMSESFKQSWKTWKKWTKTEPPRGSASSSSAGGAAGGAAAGSTAAAAAGAAAGGTAAVAGAAAAGAAGAAAAGAAAGGKAVAAGAVAVVGGGGAAAAEKAESEVGADDPPKKKAKKTPQWIVDFKKVLWGMCRKSCLNCLGRLSVTSTSAQIGGAFSSLSDL